MAELNEAQIRLGIFIIGFVVGFGVAWFFYRKGREGRERLSILQLGSIAIFFGYMIASFVLATPPSDIVLTAILGIFGGETFGKVVSEIKGGSNDEQKKD